jgi:hypothetical protein
MLTPNARHEQTSFPLNLFLRSQHSQSDFFQDYLLHANAFAFRTDSAVPTPSNTTAHR